MLEKRTGTTRSQPNFVAIFVLAWQNSSLHRESAGWTERCRAGGCLFSNTPVSSRNISIQGEVKWQASQGGGLHFISALVSLFRPVGDSFRVVTIVIFIVTEGRASWQEGPRCETGQEVQLFVSLSLSGSGATTRGSPIGGWRSATPVFKGDMVNSISGAGG